jgi:hypothetical protein
VGGVGEDPVGDRITEVHVGRIHVDLETKYHAARGNRACDEKSEPQEGLGYKEGECLSVHHCLTPLTHLISSF